MNDYQGEDDNSSYLNTLIQNLIVKSHRSSMDQSRKLFGRHETHQLLKGQYDSLRSKLLLAIHNPIAAALDPNYTLTSERQCILRTRDVTTLAYSKALQHIQDQEALLFIQLKRIVANTDSSRLSTQSLYTSPLMINIQQGKALDKDLNGKSCPGTNTSIRQRRDPTHSFPCLLHEILSNPEYSEYITWLPHGRSWKIIRRSKFERLVIPRHFRHGRYSSFMRQVNGWAFQRVTEGPEHNSYFHPQFMRDSPQLCWEMRRPLSLDTSRASILFSHWNENQRITEH